MPLPADAAGLLRVGAARAKLCPAPPGAAKRFLRVSHDQSGFCGAFVWASGALNGQTRRFPAPAGSEARPALAHACGDSVAATARGSGAGRGSKVRERKESNAVGGSRDVPGGSAGGGAEKVKITGLAQNLGQLQASHRDFQSKFLVNSKILGQPCVFQVGAGGGAGGRRARAILAHARAPFGASGRSVGLQLLVEARCYSDFPGSLAGLRI